MVWWSYVHDEFAIWPHAVKSLQVFLNDLNLFRPTIKFMAKMVLEAHYLS